MERFYRATMKITGNTLFGRLAFTFLLLCSIAFGAAVGLLFVYTSDLPEIHALEDYRPNVVTELYADDGQSIGTFALQRRILLSYGQIPKVLKDAILTTEDQHFEEHWGVDIPRVLEAASRAAIIRGPIYAPVNHPDRALARRNLVLSLMERDHKITPAQAAAATKEPLGLHISSGRNDLAPYFVEDVREYLEHTYGTAAVHEQGLRVYTSLNAAMQKAADQAVRDGLHSYDRRHGWRGNLPNILQNKLGSLDKYQNEDWRGPLQKGDYVTGLVTNVQPTFASIKLGQYHAMLTPAGFSWTGRKSPAHTLKPGDLVSVSIKKVSGFPVRVQLEQHPAAQGALLAIDNPTGEIKAMVGGYSFDESKFNRATQALRQTGSSFKVYVYADAIE